MRIIDMNGQQITTPDLTVGYLAEERLFIAHHDAVEAMDEIWHYEVVAEYPNGGREVEKVVDVSAVSAKDAWDEYETVQRYIPYTQDELEEQRKAPKVLSIEERLTALETRVMPDAYVVGTWYYRGDMVTHEGMTYVCIAPVGVVCVWSPAEYGAYWQKRN